MNSNIRTSQALDLAGIVAPLVGGCDPVALCRWAMGEAKTNRPGPVYLRLVQLREEFLAGHVPADLPRPVAPMPAACVFQASEEENWL